LFWPFLTPHLRSHFQPFTDVLPKILRRVTKKMAATRQIACSRMLSELKLRKRSPRRPTQPRFLYAALKREQNGSAYAKSYGVTGYADARDMGND
jgi:hypothetical protein